MREKLNALPTEERTRHQYQKVINAYRRVYFDAPSSGKADPSVVAVAQLLMEMGRQFDDATFMRSAIRQYEFLRREYPGSKERVSALLTIGEIYKDDLNDTARADEIFQEFLRRYSHSPLADEARANLEQPVQQASLKAKEKTGEASSKTEPVDIDSDGKQSEPITDAKTTRDKNSGTVKAKSSRVTGVRHWTLPDYTRVAIDLDQGVEYKSQHIGHPDRVFFDLLQTKLGSALVGKTFEVNDGVLKKIRVAQYKPGQARIVLEVEDHSDCHAYLVSDPARLMIEIRNKQVAGNRAKAPVSTIADADVAPAIKMDAKPSTALDEAPESAPVAGQVSSDSNIHLAKAASTTAPKKVIVEANDNSDEVSDKPDANGPASAKILSNPTLSSNRTTKGATKNAGLIRKRNSGKPVVDIREAQPTATGSRSLIRALGLKIGKIVIDPGHGGHDTGTIGPNGLQEKDLVLDVSRRLGKLLDSRLGAEVVYTRKDDTFIPLETRTSIANQEQADLFVSVHANSSRDPDARGVETYYLNFTSSPQALEVAARENAVSEKSIHELQDLVKKIALKEKIEESHEFASDVQQALHSGLAAKNPGIRDRGVKKAPFIVLIGANMPSILAEISFVSNPGDERHLGSVEYRQRIAESLYRGISKYISGLSGVKVASRMDRATGQ
ncbi:MAG: N-acetylmuramoyl-L-alanine amidase [Acidobacteriaceae bacterium]|nr:N-acetylmuramoyl-L-alanine amidase [Acidobacteriaceae bacterium]